jgi:CRP-like cAMP-binding protein
MGSLVALRTNPRPQNISILAAFGAGALIAALSVELVAPTVFALHEETGTPQHGEPLTHFFSLLIGAVLGGILFVILDQLVNAHGGFLRKAATSIAYFKTTERKRQEKLVAKLSQLPFLQNVSAQHVNALVSMIRPMSFYDGEVIARQGEDADVLFFVMEGTVGTTRDGGSVGKSGPNNVIGIIPILTQVPHPGTVTAKGSVSAIALFKEDFDHLLNISPAFDQACRDLTRKRLEVLEQAQYLSDVVFPHGDHRNGRRSGLSGIRRIEPYLVDFCRRIGGRSDAYHDCCRHDTGSSPYGGCERSGSKHPGRLFGSHII